MILSSTKPAAVMTGTGGVFDPATRCAAAQASLKPVTVISEPDQLAVRSDLGAIGNEIDHRFSPMQAMLDFGIGLELPGQKLVIELLVCIPVSHGNPKVGIVGSVKLWIIRADLRAKLGHQRSDQDDPDLELVRGGADV